jgi:hypothetical protein
MGDTSDLDRQIEQLKRCETIKECEVKALCAKAREILVEESNVQRVDSPVTVRQISSINTTLLKSAVLGLRRHPWTVLRP